MIQDKVSKLTQYYVEAFLYLYSIDGLLASQGATSTFVTCYSIMNKEQRVRCMEALKAVTEDIGNESFEDSLDFVSFLKDKFKERYNGEKTDNQ